MTRLLASLLVLASAGSAEAQLDLRVPFDTGYEYADERGDQRPHPEALRRVRTANLEEQRREGWWVFGWGIASALAGGVVAIALRDEPEWLSFGLTTAAFGAIDAGLALGMVDLSGTEREAIDAGRLGDLTDSKAILDESITAQRKAGQIFALNFGLDVAYIASGLLMFFLGRAQDPDEGLLTGSGIAMISQGAFLLGFDLIAWIRTGQRAEALEALR
jgi:hypothetical protein